MFHNTELLQSGRADLVQCRLSSEREYPWFSKSIPPLPAPPSNGSSSIPTSEIPPWSCQEAWNKIWHNHDTTAANTTTTITITTTTTAAASTTSTTVRIYFKKSMEQYSNVEMLYHKNVISNIKSFTFVKEEYNYQQNVSLNSKSIHYLSIFLYIYSIHKCSRVANVKFC